MPVSDFAYIEGRPAGTGTGTNDFAFFADESVKDDGKGTFVYEGGVRVGFGGFIIRSPFDMWITADNWYDVYINSVSNPVASVSGDETNVSFPDYEWADAEAYSGISAPSTGPGVFGFRVWNGPIKGTFGPDTQPSITMVAIAIEDADGRVYEFSPDLITFSADGVGDGYQSDGNPYNTDWVDREFDDSSWDSVTPLTESIASYEWGNRTDDNLEVSEFGGHDPHYLNQGVGVDDDLAQGWYFYRVPTTFI